MKKFVLCAMVLYSCVALAADLHVPEDIIGAQTVAIVNLNVSSIKPDQLVKTMTDIMGKAPEAGQADQLKDFLGKFTGAGGKSISIVANGSKDTNAVKSGDTAVVVIELAEGADVAKFTEFANAALGFLKEGSAPECPKAFGNKMVYYSKNFKLPAKSKERADTFSVAHGEVAEDQLLSVVFVPDDSVTDTTKQNLKPEDAEVVNAIIGGGGVCLFSNFGVSDAPTLKLLVLAADAKGAEAINKAVETGLAALKKDAPPQLKTLLDGLKLAQAGTNVQATINIIEWAKIGVELSGMKP